MAKPYKIILVNLYSPDTIAKYLLSSYLLKAYLKEDLEVLNFSAAEDVSAISKAILLRKPDCVGYSCYIWNIEKIIEVSDRIKKVISITQIFGGPEISLNRIKTLKTADYYVIGEGEKKFSELIFYLKNGGDSPPPGVAYWRDQEIKYEKADKEINPDNIPSVYLSGILPADLYEHQQAFLETQRGCRFKCKYCVYHKNLADVTYLPLERILAELKFLIEEKQIRALRIFDPIFTSDLDRAKKIVRYLLGLKRLKLNWIYWEMTPYDIDEEFIKLTASLKTQDKIMNSAKLTALDRPQIYSEMLYGYTAVNCVGIQSFHPPALRSISRITVSKEKFASFMLLVKKYNIALKIDMILGLPFETFASYFAGLEFILPYLKNTDHILNIHRLQILPGSDLENFCAEYKIAYSEKAPHFVSSTNTMSEQELAYAAKLTAILFRIVNSPLRERFFSAIDGKNFYAVIVDIFGRIKKQLPESQLIKNKNIDDIYWNGKIYQEIPARWLLDYFDNK